jgi:hypothetical protein
MTILPTMNTFSASGSNHSTAKQWFQRRLPKMRSVEPNDDKCDGMREQANLRRPQTAPTSGVVRDMSVVPAVPPISIDTQPRLHCSTARSPTCPLRPDSGVMRDVNAWLDASVVPPTPLMGGLSYWKQAQDPHARDTASTQHAIPIIQVTRDKGPSTSQSQHGKLFRRPAKGIQVQMPLLTWDNSTWDRSQKQISKRSNSMPLVAIPYEATQQANQPALFTRNRSVSDQTTGSLSSPGVSSERLLSDETHLERPRIRYGTPCSTRSSDAEGSLERRMNAVFGRSKLSAGSTRPSTAAGHLSREDSVGDYSDTPTYFTGLPPPLYRSRPASILTTSSFGCIDGMKPEQRQIRQQRAAQQRGVRCKIKKFAQSFAP